jgi:hypothetical protein
MTLMISRTDLSCLALGLPRFLASPPNTILAIERIEKGVFMLISNRVFNKANELFIDASSGIFDSLSRDELYALHTLSHDRDIIIKPADKGGAVVIVNRDAYASEARRQLYSPLYYEKNSKTYSQRHFD